MSFTAKGILATVAMVAVISLFAATQFSSGRDLTVGTGMTRAPAEGVNRHAKTDRAPIIAEPAAPTKTIGLHIERLPDTSVLVRIPLNHEARSSTPLQLHGEPKSLAACEPMVSVLTELAERLGPGRCMT